MGESILFCGGRMVTAARTWERGWLLADGERIALLGPGDPPALAADRTVECAGLTVLPGFIDVHVHGAAGHEAILFGDLNNPESEIAKRVATYATRQVREDLGLNTGVRYQGI